VASQPLSAIVVHADLHVVICAQHRSSYVKSNLQRHLRDAHLIHSSRDLNISAYVGSLDIVNNHDDISRPVDEISPIHGIPVHNGLKCTATHGDGSRYITIHEPNVKRLLRITHGKKSDGKGRPQRDEVKESEYCRVQVQALFAEKKNIDYFVVKIKDCENDIDQRASHQLLAENQQQSQVNRRDMIDTVMSSNAASLLQRGFEQAQEGNMERYTSVEKIGHVSELTAFLRESGFHAHLEGVDVAEIPAVYQLPDAAEEPELSAICSSVARVLRKAMDVLDYDKLEERQLSKLNARLLNTFRRSETSQDPIKPLQNSKSKQTYTRTLQKLFCYFSRITDHQYLQKKQMFNSTRRVAAE